MDTYKSNYGFCFNINLKEWRSLTKQEREANGDTYECLEHFKHISSNLSFKIYHNGTLVFNNIKGFFERQKEYLQENHTILIEKLTEVPNCGACNKFLLQDKNKKFSWVYCLRLNSANSIGTIVMEGNNEDAIEEFLNNIIKSWRFY